MRKLMLFAFLIIIFFVSGCGDSSPRPPCSTKFKVGQLVKHRTDGRKGVIVGIDSYTIWVKFPRHVGDEGYSPYVSTPTSEIEIEEAEK